MENETKNCSRKIIVKEYNIFKWKMKTYKKFLKIIDIYYKKNLILSKNIKQKFIYLTHFSFHEYLSFNFMNQK